MQPRHKCYPAKGASSLLVRGFFLSKTVYNKNYFPTPKAVIEQMVAPYLSNLRRLNILEPSAGMGAIVDYLKRHGGDVKKMWTCEIDQNLKAALTGKGYKVAQEDFLNYSGSLDFGLIVMNPPFDRGVDHILKAWEVLRNGDIVCLLNEETILNETSKARETLCGLIKSHGSVEFIGQAFEEADRKTGVRVAMVRLTKNSKSSQIEFSGTATDKAEDIDFSSTENGIEKRDYIDALTRSYTKAIESTETMYKAMMEFSLFTSAFCDQYEPPKLIAAFFETARKSGYSDAHNEFTQSFQRHAWNKIFKNTKVSGLMTEKVKAKFNEWREEMGGLDLNKENIFNLFDALIQQRKNIADECIVDAWDKITGNAENKTAGEKWKTNSLYMVPEKFILSWIVESSKWSGSLSVYHRKHDFLDDIDRALCLISGKLFSEADGSPGISTTFSAISGWCRDKGSPQESEFFTFKAHIKGTVHFKFKDEKLLQEFNRRACAAKGLVLPSEEIFRGKARRDQKVK